MIYSAPQEETENHFFNILCSYSVMYMLNVRSGKWLLKVCAFVNNVYSWEYTFRVLVCDESIRTLEYIHKVLRLNYYF